jgi:hypothetical protein
MNDFNITSSVQPQLKVYSSGTTSGANNALSVDGSGNGTWDNSGTYFQFNKQARVVRGTGAQLSLRYDGSNYTNFTISSTGLCTIDTFGTTQGISLPDPLYVDTVQERTTSHGIALQNVTTVTTGTAPQFIVANDGTHYLKTSVDGSGNATISSFTAAGTITHGNQLLVLAGGTPQLTVGSDGTHYLGTSVDGSGNVTIAPNVGGATVTLNNEVHLGANQLVGSGSRTGGGTITWSGPWGVTTYTSAYAYKVTNDTVTFRIGNVPAAAASVATTINSSTNPFSTVLPAIDLVMPVRVTTNSGYS